MLSALQAELAVLKLYEAYKKRTRRPLRKQPKEDKDWKYFVRAVDMFGNNEEYEPWGFVDSAMSSGKVFPAQLATKKMWENFVDYKASKEVKKDDKLVLVEKMANDYKSIKNLMKTRKIETLKEAMTNDFFLNMISRMNLDGLLFYFSKAYTNKKIPQEITLKKVIVYKSVSVRKFLNDIFSDDLYIEDIDEYIKKI